MELLCVVYFYFRDGTRIPCFLNPGRNRCIPKWLLGRRSFTAGLDRGRRINCVCAGSDLRKYAYATHRFLVTTANVGSGMQISRAATGRSYGGMPGAESGGTEETRARGRHAHGVKRGANVGTRKRAFAE